MTRHEAMNMWCCFACLQLTVWASSGQYHLNADVSDDLFDAAAVAALRGLELAVSAASPEACFIAAVRGVLLALAASLSPVPVVCTLCCDAKEDEVDIISEAPAPEAACDCEPAALGACCWAAAARRPALLAWMADFPRSVMMEAPSTLPGALTFAASCRHNQGRV